MMRLRALCWSWAILCVLNAKAHAHGFVLSDTPPPINTDIADPPLVGDKDGVVYFRDKYDFIRLYPHAWLALDAWTSAANRVTSISRETAHADLGTRFFVREAYLSLAGELLQRIGFDVGLDLTSNPAIDGTRVDGTRSSVALSNAWATLLAGRELSLTVGYFPGPYSLENRSAPRDLSQPERNLAVRGLIMPGNGKVLGASARLADQWGSWRWYADLGVFGAETLAPGEFSRNFQGMGRVVVQPLATQTASKLRNLHFGFSARYGWRVRRDTRELLSAISTGHGFAMFRPSVRDGADELLIIPNSKHYAFGAELYVPYDKLVLRAEVHQASTRTYEASSRDWDAPIRRRGVFEGLGWYAELSIWPLQLLLPIDGDPPLLGDFPSVQHIDMAALSPLVNRYGLELSLIVAGVNAEYAGSARSGSAANGGAGTRAVTIYQLGAAVNYWHTARVRFGFAYNCYWAPDSGSPDNLALSPGNLDVPPSAEAHSLHEFTARLTMGF